MLSTDTTGEVVQSFLNIAGLKGLALIDGRSRPYFRGVEQVLNAQQRDALAQGVWQVLQTIPSDFDTFEFQFDSTQVYIHKLSAELILLVLAHDSLNYPDYLDAFAQLHQAFEQNSVATTDAFQQLMGSRSAKLEPVNLTELANAAEVILPEVPSGSADYAVAADTNVTDVAISAQEPDAPANPSPSVSPSPREQPSKSEDLSLLADTLSLREDEFERSIPSPPSPRPSQSSPIPARASAGKSAQTPPRKSAQTPTPVKQPQANPAIDEVLASQANALADALESTHAGESTRSGRSNPSKAADSDDWSIDDLFRDEAETTPETLAAAIAAPPLEAYVEALNALGEFATHYLGRAVIVNYWRTSRSGDDWLQAAFAIERSANSIRLSPDYFASRQSPVTASQRDLLQAWAANFVERCSRVIRDFSQLAQASLDAEQAEHLGL